MSKAEARPRSERLLLAEPLRFRAARGLPNLCFWAGGSTKRAKLTASSDVSSHKCEKAAGLSHFFAAVSEFSDAAMVSGERGPRGIRAR
jgi:hypothetical protein